MMTKDSISYLSMIGVFLILQDFNVNLQLIRVKISHVQ